MASPLTIPSIFFSPLDLPFSGTELRRRNRRRRRPKSPSAAASPPSLFHSEPPPYPPPPPPCRLRPLLRLAVEHQDLLLLQATHASILKTQHHDDDTILANALISAYLKLHLLPDARNAFDSHHHPDVVSFTSLISAYAKCGRESDATALLDRMRHAGIPPNEFTFVAILTNCIRRSNLHLGSQIHAFSIKTHHCSSVHVANALMGMYVKCEKVGHAVKLFDEMPERDVSSWNAVILGMVEECRYEEAFGYFEDMRGDGLHGDRFSLSSVLTAAVRSSCQDAGEAVHGYAFKIGLESDLSVGNALLGFCTGFGCVEDVVEVFRGMPTRDVISWTGMLNGYMEFGKVESAVEVFEQMPVRNCVSYNALLAGFCRNGQGLRGLELFQEILGDGMEISDYTLTSVANACSMVSDRKKSEQIHAFVLKIGREPNARVDAALLDMCAKCGRMEDAEKIFERWSHVESFFIGWTSLICAHARNGQPDKAISLLNMIIERDSMPSSDKFALATVLGVCGALGFCEMGKQMHCYVLKSALLSDVAVGNAVFSMYAKCWNLNDAVSSFNQIPVPNIISWNGLITAYLLHRKGDAALMVWHTMETLGVRPDPITFVLLISACRYTSSKSVDTCRKLFLSMAGSYCIEPAPEHYAAMVDVLGYWGCFDEAERLIDNMPFKPTALVWRALLESCRLRSNLTLGKQAVQHLLALEPQDPPTYILVSNLYSASGRWHCAEKVRAEMHGKGFQKVPARSWFVDRNAAHSFYARDRSHQHSKDIYSGLDILIRECMKKANYEPDTSFVLHEVEEYQKKDFMFYHSVKLAVAYGLLMGSPGQAVRVVKNIRLCGDCHNFLKCVSSVTGREISVRDATGVHSFKGGRCLCGDNW